MGLHGCLEPLMFLSPCQQETQLADSEHTSQSAPQVPEFSPHNHSPLSTDNFHTGTILLQPTNFTKTETWRQRFSLLEHVSNAV